MKDIDERTKLYLFRVRMLANAEMFNFHRAAKEWRELLGLKGGATHIGKFERR